MHDRLASTPTPTPTGQTAAVHAIAGNRLIQIVQVVPDQAGARVQGIAELQAAAYSSSHFSSYLSLEKQIEFVSLLIAHADALVVAFDAEKPDDLLGVAVGGVAVSAGLGVFIQRNRSYLMALLATHPGHLLRYARNRLRSRLSRKPMSVAPFRLTSIAVRPDAQGAGIGGQLLAAFEGVMRTSNIVHYGLSALRRDGAAVRFYTRHGFVVETVAGDAVYMKMEIS